KLEHGIYIDSLGGALGLRDNDKILSIDEKPFTQFSAAMLREEIVLNEAKEIKVMRRGEEVVVPVDPKFTKILASSEYKDYVVVGAQIPFVIKRVAEGSNAQKAGLQAGDAMAHVEGWPYKYHHQVRLAFKQHAGKTVRIGYMRDGVMQETEVAIDEKGAIGVELQNEADLGLTSREEYSLFRAIPAGVSEGLNFMGDWFKSMGQVFKGKVKAKDSLGGFITITKLFSTSWHWESFWRITAILSFILAIMNLLPIPALDGGHVMFLLWEVVTGKKPSDKFMEYATYVGFLIVIGLIVLANGLDILRLFGK